MALGRNQTLHSPGLLNTGLADQTPHLVRDPAEDQQKAVEAKIAAYKKAGIKVPDGLTRQLRKQSGEVGAPVTDVPQPMEPGTAVPGQPLSPAPDTVPEPEDGSAPDKRAQDQTPVGFPPAPADPGPEFHKARQLPVQPQPGERVVNPPAVEKARLAHEEKVAEGDLAAGPAVGDETREEAEARRAVANQQVPAPDVEPRPTPEERVEAAVQADEGDEDDTALEGAQAAKKAAAKKAPAKKAAPRGR